MDSDVSFEDRFSVLKNWWERHNKVFSTWYLEMSPEERRSCLLKASPDLPRYTPGSREAAGQALKATDMILPELSEEALLASGGKLLVLLFARRLVSPDLCFHADIMLLNQQYNKKVLPIFSNNALKEIDTPFVDPMDPKENILSLSDKTAPETREEVMGL